MSGLALGLRLGVGLGLGIGLGIHTDNSLEMTHLSEQPVLTITLTRLGCTQTTINNYNAIDTHTCSFNGNLTDASLM